MMDTSCGEVGESLDEEAGFCFTAEQSDSGQRLDHFLASSLDDYSRSQVIQAVKSGTILLNGERTKASRKLRSGDVVGGYIVTEQAGEAEAQQIDLTVVYEDDYLIGVSKQPGLVVHPASGNPDGTLVNALLYHCGQLKGVGDASRPGIVHRLDKDTSGAMVVAKTERIHRQLVEMFKARKIQKRYAAIVHGCPKASDRIVAPIGRHPVNRQKMAIVSEGGKFAASSYSVRHRLAGFSLLDVHIETGRTHQIRVHLASIGHPVAGDCTYGSAKDNRLFPRQMLHAAELCFVHPATGRELKIEAPLWSDFDAALHRLSQNESVP